MRAVAVGAHTDGFAVAVVGQHCGVRRAAGTEDLPGEQRGAERSRLPRGAPGAPSRAGRTFPQLRQWCRRRSSVKGERHAEHWLHVLSGTHSGSRRVPAGQNTQVKAPQAGSPLRQGGAGSPPASPRAQSRGSRAALTSPPEPGSLCGAGAQRALGHARSSCHTGVTISPFCGDKGCGPAKLELGGHYGHVFPKPRAVALSHQGWAMGRAERSSPTCPWGLLTAVTLLLRGLRLRAHDLEDGFQDAPHVAGKVGLELISHPCSGRVGGQGAGGIRVLGVWLGVTHLRCRRRECAACPWCCCSGSAAPSSGHLGWHRPPALGCSRGGRCPLHQGWDEMSLSPWTRICHPGPVLCTPHTPAAHRCPGHSPHRGVPAVLGTRGALGWREGPPRG